MQRKNLHPTLQHASKDPDTLFDITSEIKVIIREITIAQYDKDYDLVSELTDELTNLMDKHENKYESYVHVIKNSLNAATGNKEIADQFMAKYTALNNLAKRLKERLHQDMKQHGLNKVDAGIFTVREQRNSVASLEVEVQPEQLPEEFQRIEIDTAELRAALEFGEEVKGASLKKGTHIRIVTKG